MLDLLASRYALGNGLAGFDGVFLDRLKWTQTSTNERWRKIDTDQYKWAMAKITVTTEITKMKPITSFFLRGGGIRSRFTFGS